jgi:uncharacterized OB-fold protein
MSQRWFPDGMPQPTADNETLPFWQAAAEHRLVVQRCTDCDHQRHPPAPVCPECRSSNADWNELSGRGELYTYTVVHRAIALGQELPFVIAVVSLEGAGGVRIISNLVDANPGELEVGMAVELVWEDMSEDLAIPRFRPIQS